MDLNLWVDVGAVRDKEVNGTPIVTIFGAGISGLTAAHELIERGFAVQVVELEADPDEEYQCRVGGLAANQYARIPEDVRRVHPYFFDEDPHGRDTDDVEGNDRNLLIWVHDNQDATDILRLGGIELELPFSGNPNPDDVATLIAVWVNSSGIATATSQANTVTVAPAPETVLHGTIAGDRRNVAIEDAAILGRLRSVEMEPVDRRFSLPMRFLFDPDTFDPLAPATWLDVVDPQDAPNRQKVDEAWERIKQAHTEYTFRQAELRAKYLTNSDLLSPRMERREVLLIEILGYTDGETLPNNERANAKFFADAVQAELLVRNQNDGTPVPDLDKHLVVVSVGFDDGPLGNPKRESQRRLSNRVELRIVEHVIPGEHGYRFFPAFYRHLFDTMSRTPILDELGEETHETALDQLRGTTEVDLALEDERPPRTVAMRPIRSFDELREALRLHLDKRLRTRSEGPQEADEDPKAGGLGNRERDLLKLQLKLLQYFTSGERRRREKYEDESWWEFLDGDSFEPEMQRLLLETPQALVAMNARETDARTQGTIFCQLLLDNMMRTDQANGTLNGPTTDAWLVHWKRYLRQQGVRFFTGRLVRLEWFKNPADGSDHLLPIVEDLNPVPKSQFSLMVDEADDLSVTIDGNQFLIPAGPGASTMSLRDELVQEINGAGAGLEATSLADRGLLVRAERLIEVQGDSSVAHHVVINGIRVSASPPGQRTAEQIRDLLVREIRDAGLSLGVLPIDQHKIHISPVGAARIVSMIPLASKYVIEVNHVRVEVSPTRTGAIPRDDLIQAIQTNPALNTRVIAHPFGRDGIELVPAAGVVLHCAPGGEGIVDGLRIFVWSDGAPSNLIVPPPHPIVVIPGPTLVVEGPTPEVAGEEYIVQLVGAQGLLPSPGGGPDFYVMALPFLETLDLVLEAKENEPVLDALDGCLAQLLGFGEQTMKVKPADAPLPPPVRDADGRPAKSLYPLRDFAGIQYYFQHQVRVGRGHSYFPHAPWGLSSISQLSYWRDRPSLSGPFLGQLSVDIGNFYAQNPRSVVAGSSTTPGLQPSAWNSSAVQIAEETWAQVKAGLDKRLSDHVVQPAYYHLDQGLEFEGADGYEFARFAHVSVVRDEAATYSLTLDGGTFSRTYNSVGQATTAAADLAQEIRDNSACAATEVPGSKEFVIASVAAAERKSEIRTIRLYVRPISVQTIAWLNINGNSFAVPIPAGTTPADARNRIVDAINDNAPGVTARRVRDKKNPVEATAALRIDATRRFTVSVVACADIGTGGVQELYHAIWMAPAGWVAIEIDDANSARLSILDVESRSVAVNRTPLMINPPETWKHRPGYHDPTEDTGHGSKTWVMYKPTNHRWLSIGNHMATTTRLATMESANESARHAVIAMLHAVAVASGMNVYNGQGTLLGDFPEIWDPEEHEFDDAAMLKRLDDRLREKKLPHLMEILRLHDMAESLPPQVVAKQFPKQLGAIVRFARQTAQQDLKFSDAEQVSRALQRAMRAAGRVPRDLGDTEPET